MLVKRVARLIVRSFGSNIRLIMKRVCNALGVRAKRAIGNLTLFFEIVRSNLRILTYPNKPQVTIFGSCRQDSVYRYFKVTNIRNGLTYPHYSKEVIQAINYCKNREFGVPPIAFRNTQIFTKLASRRSLKRSFEKTDIFIVEIASMLEYRYQGSFLHHEIYDNSMLHQNFPGFNLSNVERYEQSSFELKTDLETIVELLKGKEIIFACHFNTRETGRRAELESIILEFCQERQIVTFTPKELLDFYTEKEIFVNEKVLSHFTEFGHRIAGYRFRELIEVLNLKKQSSNPPLVQKLEKPPSDLDGFTSGFGDFLNGSLKIYEVARRLNRIPLVDLSDSVLESHLINRFTSKSFGDVRKIFHNHHDFAFSQSIQVFTNKIPSEEINDESRDFIYRNCLSQRENQKQELNRLFKELGIKAHEYMSLHIRIDDKFDLNPEESMLRELNTMISKLDFSSSRKIILLSNSNSVRKYFSDIGIVSPAAHVRHSADPAATASSISNMLSEFYILGKSEHIYQLSTYEWGSGFSSLAAKLFNVPITKMKIGS